MNYAFETRSGVTMYVHIKFLKDWFTHAKINGADTHTDTQTHRHTETECDLMFTLFFVLNT
jgi:hypothetical protein